MTRRLSRHQHGDMFAAQCWCERKILDVPVSLVRQFKTLSCGRPGCADPDDPQAPTSGEAPA